MAEIRLTPAQMQAVGDRGGALLVSAAAGSGKTKVLVDRLLAQVCREDDPANIDEFLIITYTNAAASELRGKIAAELGKRLAQRPDNRHLQRQLTRLYLTQISTVHAFCASVLRSYAHVLDIPADFRVAEEQESRALRQRVFDEVLEEKYASIKEDEAFREMIDKLGYGRDDRRLAGALLPVYDQIRCRVDPEAWMRRCEQAYELQPDTDAGETIWGAYLLGELHETLAAAERNLSELRARLPKDELLEKKYGPLIDENLSDVRNLMQKKGWDESLEHMVTGFGSLPPIKAECDQELRQYAKSVRKEALQSIREASERLYGSSARVTGDLLSTKKTIRGLLALLRAFDARYTQEKRRRRIFDFSDLEHEAIRLLTDRQTGRPTASAREIAGKYREILVDEYQDSNAVQECIFEAVSRDGTNRFSVGDVKQSIYRFRLAEPELFLKKYETYAPAGSAAEGEPRKLLLSENFRSRPEILQAVNDVFSLVMSRASGDLDYGPGEALRPGRGYLPTPQKKVELHCIGQDVRAGEDEASPEKSEYEAAFVAGRVRELLRNGTMIQDGETLRPAEPGDIAILMRSPGRTAALYTAALAEYGIASVSDRGGSILETTEAEVLSAILCILDNPHQDIPLVTAMASQVFAFSPDELAAPRTVLRTGDYCDCLMAYPGKSPKLEAFLSWLGRMRAAARRLTLRELIDEVLLTTGLEDVYAAMPDGMQRAENLTAYRELAASFEKTGSRSLMEWNLYLEQLRESGTGVLPQAPEHARDAVSIMSIHKSKGLEFPIVILADLSRKFNLQDNQAGVLLDSELMIGCNVVDLPGKAFYPSAARMAIADKKTRQTVSEELRVLYVGMTRAREMLIMTYCSGLLTSALGRWNASVSVPVRPEVSSSARSLGDWILMAALCRTEAGELFEQTGPNAVSRVWSSPWEIRLHKASELPGIAAARGPASRGDGNGLPAGLLERELGYRYPHEAASKLPSKLTATQLKGRLLDFEAAEDAQTPRESEPIDWRQPDFLPDRPLEGREKGNATHLFMQFARYEACTGEKELQAELERLQAQKFLSPAQAQAVNRDWILTLFTGPFGRRILDARNVRREFKFSILTDAARYAPEAAGEQVLLQGVVDCFWEEPGGLVLVDYKTDRVRGDPAERTARYTPQLQAYAEALERIFQKPVKQAWLYFFDCAQPVPVPRDGKT